MTPTYSWQVVLLEKWSPLRFYLFFFLFFVPSFHPTQKTSLLTDTIKVFQQKTIWDMSESITRCIMRLVAAVVLFLLLDRWAPLLSSCYNLVFCVRHSFPAPAATVLNARLCFRSFNYKINDTNSPMFCRKFCNQSLSRPFLLKTHFNNWKIMYCLLRNCWDYKPQDNSYKIANVNTFHATSKLYCSETGPFHLWCVAMLMRGNLSCHLLIL